jgi:hypothetical protein
MKMYFVAPSHTPIMEMYIDLGVKNFLVSYFYDKKGEQIQKIRDKVPDANIMMDSGAYSAFSLGRPIDVKDYIDYVKIHGHNVDEVISLDVIGSGKGSKENFDAMLDAGVDSIPVYHMREPYEYLEYYIKKAHYIGLGGNNQDDQRIFFNYLQHTMDKVPEKIKLHLFGVMNLDLLFRFAERLESCDASSAIKVTAYNSTVSYTGIGRIVRGGAQRLTSDDSLHLHKYTVYKYLEMEKQINETVLRRKIKMGKK